MNKNSTSFPRRELGPSDYTIKFLLDFSKSIRLLELKKFQRTIIHCN